MQFNKLQITGFKSFVEPTDFIIEQGLTGIVGPNGCGKSNVVESLRWAMGENSAKRLRGSEMDDVIFSGSAGRPARNIAEVSLVLDNRARDSLAEFNNDDVIEVTRRIERGMGSSYSINSRPVRQKDVQLLFADQATGAHSTSIVSQGRISALIQAKPEERRQVLEEAAGVAGLHARRHEAELKLKAAEANLARVGDQLQNMDQQLRALKTQVRQTSRYRNLGELIRKAEAGVLHIKSRVAQENLRAAETAFAESEARVRDNTAAVAQASTAATESAASLPPLRQNEAAAAAVVQRLFLETETLEREAKRLAQAQESLLRRMEEAKGDRAREESLLNEARAALTSLASEKEEAQRKLAALQGEGPALESRAASAREQAEAQERAFQEKTAAFADMAARAKTLTRDMDAAQTRLEALASKIAEAEKNANEAQSAVRSIDIAFSQALVTTAENELTRTQQETQAAQSAQHAAEEALSKARAARDALQADIARATAEMEALRGLLQSGGSESLAGQLSIENAYEAALAAALGEGLFATLDSSTKAFWQDLGASENAAFPQGVEPLLSHVKAPAALKRALSFVGLVAGEEEGNSLSRQLKPGQILVSKEGAFWRWDGYTRRKDAETPAAAHLRQSAKLKEAERALARLVPHFEEAKTSAQQAEAAAQNARQRAQQLDAGREAAFNAVSSARQQHAETARKLHEAEARLSTFAVTLSSLRNDEGAARADLDRLTQEQAALPNLGQQEEILQAARQESAGRRALQIEAEAALASYQSSLQALEARVKSAEDSLRSWNARTETGQRHVADLATRLESLEQEAEALAARPQQMEAERQELLTRSHTAEEQRRQAGDALLQAEQKQAGLEKIARGAEEALMQSKENRVRAEEQMYRARGSFDELALRIREHWQCAPEELAAKAGLESEDDQPTLEQLENDLARYTRERENMGPVNLRADIEAEEIQAQMDKISADKNDLEGAIAKLRQGISALNREAGERLDTAFAEVNKNFGQLFERLFGGGRAHLSMLENDDPLQAGLEIYASPPGKRLQALSLLSGGEQALTALSLLFALFLVNPSPICVLDEVDAPLDEANVDRFCTMLREMAEGGKTRFLVITHHRLTMARMDRLFGVTMAEKGVSSLVSVDLKQALALREQGNEAAGAYADAAAAE